MDLVQIDDIHLQTAQAGFAFPPDGIGFRLFRIWRFSFQMRSHLVNTYGRFERPFESARHHFFRMAEAVNRGGIDPVDAAIQRGVDGRDRFVVVLGPQANAHPPPPMAQAPTPIGVICMSLFPSCLVCIVLFILIDHVAYRKQVYSAGLRFFDREQRIFTVRVKTVSLALFSDFVPIWSF